jgi:nitroreductase
MEFSDVLAKRRMVRNYTDDPIEEAVLDRIAAAALRAPSAGNSQAIGVVVVTDEPTRRQIADIADEPAYVNAGFDPWISTAPAHIVISVSEKIYRDRYSEPDKLGEDGRQIDWPIPYWWVDAGASMMAVLLSAVDEGLAAGFLGVHSVPDLSELLGVPGHYDPIGVVTVGHPAPDRRSGSLKRLKKTPDDVVFHDRWGSRAV